MKTSVSRFPAHDSALARAVAEFCLSGWKPPTAQVRQALRSERVWKELAATGTALWLDTGDVDAARELWTREFVALTTNNTLLNKEVQKGIYDQLVPKAAAVLKKAEPGMPQDLVVQEVAFVLNAVHGLKLVSMFDADVSVELHTSLARDPDASYHYGKRFAAINKERFIVKVPLTPEGLFAARRLRADGVRVNFTLGFSARENYLIALVARPNWVNVFMGRCNAFVVDNQLGDGKNVGEKATLSSQRVMKKLRAEQKIDVRQIGASMRNGDQAFDLMGLDVFTMPTGVAKEYLQRAPKTAEVRDRTSADPPVALAAGKSVEKERIDSMWAIPDAFGTAMCKLCAQDLDKMTAAQLRAFLIEHGARDLFGELSAEDAARVAKDGKIPKYEPWAARVQKGELSWDGLLTAAGLASFADDQKKLDERVRGLV